MAIIHIGNIKINKSIQTPSFLITEVEVIDNHIFAIGHGCLANMKVSVTVSSIDKSTVQVGYTVINKDNRLLSYKGVFTMAKYDSVSEQILRVLASL